MKKVNTLTDEARRKLQSDVAKLDNDKCSLESKKIVLEDEVADLKEKKSKLINEYSFMETTLSKEDRISLVESIIEKNDIKEFYDLVIYVSNKSNKDYSMDIRGTVTSYAVYFDLFIKSRNKSKKHKKKK